MPQHLEYMPHRTLRWVMLPRPLLWAVLWACLGEIQLEMGGDLFMPRNPVRTGQWIKQTQGEVWPKPNLQIKTSDFLVLSSRLALKIATEHVHGPCDIIDAAISRYTRRIFPPAEYLLSDCLKQSPGPDVRTDRHFVGYLDRVEIIMNNRNGCQRLPSLDMDEKYEINVNMEEGEHTAKIIASSVWGILRGLETFSQMVYTSHRFGHNRQYLINSSITLDSPRFPHRGILLDTSRHYIAKSVLMDNIDLMEMNKLNVFHWHMTDDPSFPYVSKKFPNLSAKGAFHGKIAVYSQEDVLEIIEYARLRGIRVIAEFDTPGHTQSFEPGHPGLLTKCYTNGKPDGSYGPMNPTSDQVFKFLEKFFEEIVSVFPDEYLHLGGDEVDFQCWDSNPGIRKFMQKWGIPGNYRALEGVFIQKLLNILRSISTNNQYIMWQEVFDNQVNIANDTIIHVWKDWGSWQWEREMTRVTDAGLRAILSSPWYLNYINYGSDWTKFYMVDPHNFSGSDEQKQLVLGGEACMWGEFVNSVNLTPRMWPRASAVAERLWSASEVNDISEAKHRLQEMECRMLKRGFPVEPANGPAFCNVDWNL